MIPMEFKKLAGVDIPVLGMGTWGMGGSWEKDTEHDREEIAALKAGLKLGMTHIDTAERYGQGHAEELVGKAINGFPRKGIFITTKVWTDNLAHDDLISSAKKSLKRLGTNYVDLYLIHGPNPQIPIKETVEAMDYLVKKRMTRFIGVSNFFVKQLREAQNFAQNRIVANQIEYNLLVRNKGIHTDNMESEIIPYCQENGIMVIAWRPLGKGNIARHGIRLLDELSRKYGKTQAQIALNWLISKEGIITIPKATSTEHQKENLGALGWSLRPEDAQKLDGLKNSGS
jgi:diketogulonate reductase-like aldo/keto reductase